MQHHALLIISTMFLTLYLLSCIHFLKNFEQDTSFVICYYPVCCYLPARLYIFE